MGLLVLIGGAVLLAWRDGMRGRELAVTICRRLCESYELQLLDDTVALSSVRLARSRRSGVTLRRVYSFDFSRDGAQRETGSVTLFEGTLEAAYLPPGTTRPT